jgi:hypothetical protein
MHWIGTPQLESLSILLRQLQAGVEDRHIPKTAGVKKVLVVSPAKGEAGPEVGLEPLKLPVGGMVLSCAAAHVEIAWHRGEEEDPESLQQLEDGEAVLEVHEIKINMAPLYESLNVNKPLLTVIKVTSLTTLV